MDSLLVNLFVYSNPLSTKLIDIIYKKLDDITIKGIRKLAGTEVSDVGNMLTQRQNFITYMITKVFNSNEPSQEPVYLRPEVEIDGSGSFNSILRDFGCKLFSKGRPCSSILPSQDTGETDLINSLCIDCFRGDAYGTIDVFFLQILSILIPNGFYESEIEFPCHIHNLRINTWENIDTIQHDIKKKITNILDIPTDEFIIIQPYSHNIFINKKLSNIKEITINSKEYTLCSCITSTEYHYMSIIGNLDAYYFVDIGIDGNTTITQLNDDDDLVDNDKIRSSKISLMFYYRKGTELKIIKKYNTLK